MQCPKCRFEQHIANVECARCGVIFAKYQAVQRRKQEMAEAEPDLFEKDEPV